MEHHEITPIDKERFNELMANPDIVAEVTLIFDALRDKTRLKILADLMMGEKNVSELQENANVSQSAVSHQLRLLRDRGLVVARRQAQKTYYSLADEHVYEMIMLGIEHGAEPFESR